MTTQNFQNRTLFKGDNLDFLRGMNSETVDLIATDPPFNKGKDFHATPESLAAGARFQDRWTWDDDVQPEWVDSIKDERPRVYSLIDYVIGGLSNDTNTRKKWGGREDIGAFLCFMGVRLIEMRRILKDSGSLYLHCDPTASHYLKALMDAVFGDRNFRNEIIWGYRKMPNRARSFQKNHDIILFYTKTDEYHFNTLRGAFTESSKKTYERAERVGYNVNHKKKMATVWDWDKYNEAVESGVLPADLDPVPFTNKGPALWDWWTDVPILSPSANERTGYPTQKPLALYERIIKASSNPGDMVLDPFAGCATTPIAAERLGRQWIGIDLWDGAYEIVQQRMEDGKQLLDSLDAQIIYTEDAPERDDGGEDAPTFELQLQTQRPVERWQKLSHAEMRDILYDAQNGVCAGCGRELEKEFMELDHKLPRADGGVNDITNRIMLCSPCNRKKSHTLTLSGLVRENKKSGWMKSENRARQASSAARLKADMIKNSGLIK